MTANDSAIYQQYNLVNGQPVLADHAARGHHIAITPFPGNVIPKSMLDASALKSAAVIVPASSYYLNSNGLISNIFTPRLLAQDEKRYTIRIDQNLQREQPPERALHRYADRQDPGHARSARPPTAPNIAGPSRPCWPTPTRSRPPLFNDLRLNYTRGRFSNTAAPEYDAQTGSNLNTELGLPNLTKGGVPLLGGLFPGSSWAAAAARRRVWVAAVPPAWTISEERYASPTSSTRTHGAMSWKFGVDVSHSLQNVIPLFAALGGSYAFCHDADQLHRRGHRAHHRRQSVGQLSCWAWPTAP